MAKRDAVVCAVGAVTPERRELDDEAMRGAVVVESREAAEREPGDILLAKAAVSAELGELLNGGAMDRKGGPVVFKSWELRSKMLRQRNLCIAGRRIQAWRSLAKWLSRFVLRNIDNCW